MLKYGSIEKIRLESIKKVYKLLGSEGAPRNYPIFVLIDGNEYELKQHLLKTKTFLHKLKEIAPDIVFDKVCVNFTD